MATPLIAHAQDLPVDVAVQQSNVSQSSAGLIIARVFQIVLGFLGVVALGFLVYAAYLYLSAEGSEEQTESAKRIVVIAIVAIVIIFLSFLGLTVIISRMQQGPIVQAPASQPQLSGLSFAGDFPLGAIEAHYPEQGQTNVPRNTGIIVTFVEPMLASSLVNDNNSPNNPTDDFVNLQGIRVLKLDDDAEQGPFVSARATLTDDQRTVFLQPLELLGSSEVNTNYKVILTEEIKSADGSSIFEEGGFSWQFEVGTFVDNTPPQLDSFIPIEDSSQPRNVVVQMNFNEAMNPITVIGDIVRGFDMLAVRDESGEILTGRFLISNQFRTVEFLTTDACGKNSCGEDIFCLPGNSELEVTIRAASVGLQPPTAAFPFDGVTDAATNAFDGNKDGAAEGPQVDSIVWGFSTTSEIDNTPPVITDVAPSPFSTLVPLDSEISALFNKVLMTSTINRQSFRVFGLANYALSTSIEGNTSKVNVIYDRLDVDTTYRPNVTSDVKDIFQNCYTPSVGP